MSDLDDYILDRAKRDPLFAALMMASDSIQRQVHSVTPYPERGYEVRKETWTTDGFGGDPTEMEYAYSVPDGYSIGKPERAEHLYNKFGITEWGTYQDSDSGTCCCGFSPRDNKWYGWSHRAIAGFGEGDKIFEEEYGDDNTPFTEHGTKDIADMADAKFAAQNFARMVAHVTSAGGPISLQIRDIVRVANKRTSLPYVKEYLQTDPKGEVRTLIIRELEDPDTRGVPQDKLYRQVADSVVTEIISPARVWKKRQELRAATASDWDWFSKSAEVFTNIFNDAKAAEKSGDVEGFYGDVEEGLDQFADGKFPHNVTSNIERWFSLFDGSLGMDARAVQQVSQEMEDVRKRDDYRVSQLRFAMWNYIDTLNSHLKELTPEKLTIKGIRVENPDRVPEHVMRQIADAIEYLLMTFKLRGVGKVIAETLKSITIRFATPQDGDRAHGFYNSRNQNLTILVRAAKQGDGGRFLKTWLHEVILHEIGHHVHLHYMPKEAREEWDSGWDIVEKAKAAGKVSHKERVRFFKMLEKARGDLKKIKLKGLDRMKFHAWLAQPTLGGPLVTKKQLRWSKEAISNSTVAMFQDFDAFADENGERTAERRWRNLEGKLGVSSNMAGQSWPILKPSEVGAYADIDKEVQKAIDSLDMPSGYAKTDVMEDFAETFVAFIDAPQKLSQRARARMQRALYLSGLHGKPVTTKIGAKVTTGIFSKLWKCETPQEVHVLWASIEDKWRRKETMKKAFVKQLNKIG